MPLSSRFASLLVSSALAVVGGVAAPNPDPYPTPASKKGLQVQMVDDALALGVKHAALNFNLAQLIDPAASAGGVEWKSGGRVFTFHRGFLEAYDSQVKRLSDNGVVVSLILLNYVGGDSAIERILRHPDYEASCPNHLSAFNTRTDEGRAWLRAAFELIADRWSGSDATHGRVWNWILGNEVNSHGFWCNEGPKSMEAFADDYLSALRIAHTALRTASANARLFVSLEHHWNIRYAGADERHGFPARPFLEYLAKRSRDEADWDWHVAFHPYPEDLFHPQTWLDKSAQADFATTPRITFKNIGELPRFLAQPAMLCRGAPRRVILSEQGFHTPDGADGELIQAAAFCYAWKKVETLEGVDAFILHRHVDHGAEGGLRLGLWRRDTASTDPARPFAKKRIYEAFRAADTPDWAPEFRFALPIIGVPSWEHLP